MPAPIPFPLPLPTLLPPRLLYLVGVHSPQGSLFVLVAEDVFHWVGGTPTTPQPETRGPSVWDQLVVVFEYDSKTLRRIVNTPTVYERAKAAVALATVVGGVRLVFESLPLLLSFCFSNNIHIVADAHAA